MKDYNPVDVCHYCNDRMYEQLKQKIHKRIQSLENDGYSMDNWDLLDELKSLLENEIKEHKQK